jgi:hypothetical protein
MGKLYNIYNVCPADGEGTKPDVTIVKQRVELTDTEVEYYREYCMYEVEEMQDRDVLISSCDNCGLLTLQEYRVLPVEDEHYPGTTALLKCQCRKCNHKQEVLV